MPKKADKDGRELKKQAAEIKKLRRRLKKGEEATAKWKAKAKGFEAEAAKRHKQVKKLRQDLPTLRSGTGATLGSATSPPTSALPDESWTVTRLRASAREAAVPRYSRMTKAELVEALTRPTEE